MSKRWAQKLGSFGFVLHKKCFFVRAIPRVASSGQRTAFRLRWCHTSHPTYRLAGFRPFSAIHQSSIISHHFVSPPTLSSICAFVSNFRVISAIRAVVSACSKRSKKNLRFWDFGQGVLRFCVENARSQGVVSRRVGISREVGIH